MFLIQTAPAPGILTAKQYADMLFNRIVQPHLTYAGALQVLVLFDDPDNQTESPKEIERHKRDSAAHVESMNVYKSSPLNNAYRFEG